MAFARGLRLLEFDSELSVGLSQSEVAEVSQRLVLPVARVPAGDFTIESLTLRHGVKGPIRGLMLLEGSIAANLAITHDLCTRIITVGEFVLMDGMEDSSMRVRSSWTALRDSQVAIFDQRLALIGRHWPALMVNLLERAAQHLRHALLQQAISQLPRVEDRLLGLMWSVADRVGHMSADGVVLDLPITHQQLAQMIGARRPTVSLGLKKLAEEEALVQVGDRWLLTPDSVDRFQAEGLHGHRFI